MWKVKELEQLATNMVGDGKKPNLFFVSIKGTIVTITRDFNIAYDQWEASSNVVLEDRQHGVLASATETEIFDDTQLFKLR